MLRCCVLKYLKSYPKKVQLSLFLQFITFKKKRNNEQNYFPTVIRRKETLVDTILLKDF